MKLRLVIAVFVTALTLSATAMASGLSKPNYIAKADAICKASDAVTEPMGKKVDQSAKANNYGEAASEIRSIISREQADLNKLKALSAGPKYKAVADKIWSSLAKVLPFQVGMAKAIGKDDVLSLSSAEHKAAVAQALYKGLAQGFGLHFCGK